MTRAAAFGVSPISARKRLVRWRPLHPVPTASSDTRSAPPSRSNCRQAQLTSGAMPGPGPTRPRPARRSRISSSTANRSGQPEAAKADVAKLMELRDKLREAKDAYWSEQVDIQAQVAGAWLLYAEGKHDDAHRHFITIIFLVNRRPSTVNW